MEFFFKATLAFKPPIRLPTMFAAGNASNTIIFLQGLENSGKSRTVQILHSILVDHDYRKIPLTDTVPGTFTEIVEKNGKLIGITNDTNVEDGLHTGFHALLNSRCNIIVCCCDSQLNCIGDMKTVPEYESKLVLKTSTKTPSLHERINHGDALNLFMIIQSAVSVE